MKAIIALLLLGVACLSLVEAGEYSITISADRDGTWSNGMLSVQSRVVDQSGGIAAGDTLVNGASDFVQLDLDILQAIPASLTSIQLQQTTAGATYTFYGSNTLNQPVEQQTRLATGVTSISGLNSQWQYFNANGYPTDANGQAFRYLSITCTGGNVKLTIIIIIVVCQPCDATTTTRGTGNIPPGGNGDPQFNGLQHQNFQFHGMADESFSLISSPDVRVNSLFKYIASGSCDYNDTVCWTHPGTYLDQIGLTFGHNRVLLKSGSHSAGMKVYINERELAVSTKQHSLTARNATATVKFLKPSVLVFETDIIYIRIINSDYFFNFDFGLKDPSILRAGAKQVAITGEICELEARAPLTKQHKSAIQQQLTAAYPAYPLHGLVGQTWRNAMYCGRYFEGSVDDYVTGDLFANPTAFNYFNY